MTRRTPGTWQVLNGGALIGTAEDSDGSRYIADIRYIPGGESVSNAHVIAAAPDLEDAVHSLYNQMLIARGYMLKLEARGELLSGLTVADWFDEPMRLALEAIVRAGGR